MSTSSSSVYQKPFHQFAYAQTRGTQAAAPQYQYSYYATTPPLDLYGNPQPPAPSQSSSGWFKKLLIGAAVLAGGVFAYKYFNIGATLSQWKWANDIITSPQMATVKSYVESAQNQLASLNLGERATSAANYLKDSAYSIWGEIQKAFSKG